MLANKVPMNATKDMLKKHINLQNKEISKLKRDFKKAGELHEAEATNLRNNIKRLNENYNGLNARRDEVYETLEANRRLILTLEATSVVGESEVETLRKIINRTRDNSQW